MAEPAPAEPILHLALIGFGVGDEFLEIVHRQVRPGDDRDRSYREIGHRREIGLHIVERLLVERLVLRMRADAAEHHRVAVRLGIGDALGTGHATGAADVLDDDLLAEQFAHALRHDAADRVLRSAGGERNDHRHGARREILSAGLASRNASAARAAASSTFFIAVLSTNRRRALRGALGAGQAVERS